MAAKAPTTAPVTTPDVDVVDKAPTTAPVTTPDVDVVGKLPGSTVSAVVSAVLSEAVESHRWSERMSRADVVKQALTEWAEKRDLLDGARARLAEKVAASE